MYQNTSQKHATIVALSALLILNSLQSAFAATGGRMGGQFFSESDASSKTEEYDSYYTRSYADPHYHDHHCLSSSDCRRFDENNIGENPSTLFDVVVKMGFVGGSLAMVYYAFKKERASVLMVQVGLSGKARSLQKQLNEIAKSADTSTVKGLNYILRETTIALLRHPDYWISGHSCVDVKWSIKGAEKRFNQLSVEEREKFDIETLVNVNNIKRQITCIPEADWSSKDYVVITILVAAKGTHKLPVISDTEELKDALQCLNSIRSAETLAAEVLWTPQDENDTLSEQELIEKYTLLRPI